MSETLTIIYSDYAAWIEDLIQRYSRSQIKAAHSVNKEMLSFYWSLGRDIEELHAESRWGDKFFKNLRIDLKSRIPNATSFSPTNLLYIRNFYKLYQSILQFTPQIGEQYQQSKKSKRN